MTIHNVTSKLHSLINTNQHTSLVCLCVSWTAHSLCS